VSRACGSDSSSLLQRAVGLRSFQPDATEHDGSDAVNYTVKHSGLCRDATANGINNCECEEELLEISKDQCESECDLVEGCTGIAYHEGARRCKIYTNQLSDAWTSSGYLLWTCYERNAPEYPIDDEEEEDDSNGDEDSGTGPEDPNDDVEEEDEENLTVVYFYKHKGLCRDGTTHTDCQCEEVKMGLTTYDQCATRCNDVDGCTGFAYHKDSLSCAIYTQELSGSWTGSNFLKWICYEKHAINGPVDPLLLTKWRVEEKKRSTELRPVCKERMPPSRRRSQCKSYEYASIPSLFDDGEPLPILNLTLTFHLVPNFNITSARTRPGTVMYPWLTKTDIERIMDDPVGPNKAYAPVNITWHYRVVEHDCVGLGSCNQVPTPTGLGTFAPECAATVISEADYRNAPGKGGVTTAVFSQLPLEAIANTTGYHVWFMPYTGQTSQGRNNCAPHTRYVELGLWSDKYGPAVKRNHAGLALTLSHELGHGLGLGHSNGEQKKRVPDRMMSGSHLGGFTECDVYKARCWASTGTQKLKPLSNPQSDPLSLSPEPRCAADYTVKHQGLCRDVGTEFTAPAPGQEAVTGGRSLEMCKNRCNMIAAWTHGEDCTGFAYHEDAQLCRVYTGALSDSWTAPTYLKWRCYERVQLGGGPPNGSG